MAQQTAIGLFAAGVLLTLLALITGESVWQTLHNALFGVFGVLAFAAGPFLIWFAIAFAFGKRCSKKAFSEFRVPRHFWAPSPMNSTGPCSSHSL